MAEFSPRTDHRLATYLIFDERREVVGVRWDLLNRKQRNRIKLALKRSEKRIRAYYEMRNRYCGREDVFVVHARIGGNNWFDWKADQLVGKQPWFLEKVDDYFDRTYCDIYVLVPQRAVS